MPGCHNHEYNEFISQTPIPTSSPTQSKQLGFICYYEDNRDYVTTYLSLSIYAKIMVDAILDTIPTFLLQSVHYEETQRNELALWKRGGIVDFFVCYIFDSELTNASDQCDYDLPINIEGNYQYIAHGLFKIVADEALSLYQDRIIEVMTSENFKVVFNRNMNDRMGNITNNNIRRLEEYESFNMIQIQAFDPLNVSRMITTQSEQYTPGFSYDNPGTLDSLSLIIIVCGALLFIIVCILGLWRNRVRQKNKDSKEGTEGVQYNSEIQMSEKGNEVKEGGEGFEITQNDYLDENDRVDVMPETQDLFAELDNDVEDEHLAALDEIGSVNNNATAIGHEQTTAVIDDDIIHAVNATHGESVDNERILDYYDEK